MSETYDNVWHQVLQHKIEDLFTLKYYNTLKSYLSDREFRTNVGEELTRTDAIKAGIRQVSVLGTIGYILCIADLPTCGEITIGIFIDDTIILAMHENPTVAI